MHKAPQCTIFKVINTLMSFDFIIITFSMLSETPLKKKENALNCFNNAKNKVIL